MFYHISSPGVLGAWGGTSKTVAADFVRSSARRATGVDATLCAMVMAEVKRVVSPVYISDISYL